MPNVPQSDETVEPSAPSIPVRIAVVHHLLIGLATALPWVIQFTLNGWLAIGSWVGLIALYDRLFVPKNSLCMGIPFMIPLSSFMLLIFHNLFLLCRWLLN